MSPEDKLTKALLLALGVCYHSSLKSRDEYRQTIARYFMPPLQLSDGAAEMEQEITRYMISCFIFHQTNIRAFNPLICILNTLWFI